MDIFLAEPSSGPRVNCSYAANGTSSGLLGQVSGAKSVPANILKDHENSATNAILYIGIVLAVYVLAVCFIGFRYFLTKSQRKLLFTPYYFTRTKSESRAENGIAATTPSSSSRQCSQNRTNHRSNMNQRDSEAFSEGLIETEL